MTPGFFSNKVDTCTKPLTAHRFNRIVQRLLAYQKRRHFTGKLVSTVFVSMSEYEEIKKNSERHEGFLDFARRCAEPEICYCRGGARAHS